MKEKNSPMDNFKIHVKACSDFALETALKLAFDGHDTVVAWSADDDWLVLYWSDTKDSHKFPSKLTAKEVYTVVGKWINEHDPKDDYPDLDGHCSKGFELKTPDCLNYETVRVRSIWAWHHK